MRARLFARFGPEAGCEIELGREATIGRGEENDLVLSSPEVSKRHARVVFDDEAGAYYVEDLDSLNGTRLDGVRLRDRERLGAVHVLGLGEAVELFFVEMDRSAVEEAAEAPEEAAVLAREGTRVDVEAPTLPVGLRREKGAKPAAGSSTQVEKAPAALPGPLGEAAAPAARAERPDTVGSAFVLEVTGLAPGRFRLLEGDNLIGRAGKAVVRLRARELSRRHATLRIEGDRAWLRDENSRNHTYVGSKRIDREVELTDGAELRFGKIEARLVRIAEEGDGGDG